MTTALASLLVAIGGGGVVADTPPAPSLPVTIDLTRPFATRTSWRLTAGQGATIPDPILGEGRVPGTIDLCLHHAPAGPCRLDLSHLLTPSGGADAFSDAHELQAARIVRPPAQAPLLLLRVASLHGVNGDQRIAITLLAYDRPHDRFAPVFTQQTGRNNNQEVRYIDRGPLAGHVIVAAPTRDAPFAYWITVNAPAGAQPYRQTLRFRSTTRYGDGDRRAVIDAEMPTILRRLHAG